MPLNGVNDKTPDDGCGVVLSCCSWQPRPCTSWEPLPPLPVGWALEVKIAECVFNPPLSKGVPWGATQASEPQLFL